MKTPRGWQVQSKPVARSAIRPKPRKSVSPGEKLLSSHLDVYKIEYTKEFRFHPERRWKADFRIDGYPILVEVEGGVYSNGRHTRGEGYSSDCEKYSTAAVMGWIVIRGTTDQVKKGLVIEWIRSAIEKLKV